MASVEKLRLLRFRSWPRAEIAFSPGLTALVGPNGVGKTNILEALSYLTGGRGLRAAKPDALAHNHDPLGWQVHANLDDLTEISVAAQPGGTRQIQIDEARATQTRLSQMSRQLWLTPAMDRLWVDRPEDRRRFLDRITLAFFPQHGAHVMAYEKAMRERNRLFRIEHPDPSWFSALEVQMAEHGAAITQARLETLSLILDAQGRAEHRFPAGQLSLTHPDRSELMSDKDHLIAAFERGRRHDFDAGRSLIGPHRADLEAVFINKSQPAALCSTGEQKAMMISILLAAAHALGERDQMPLVLMDEVAAHLDETRRAALFEAIDVIGCQAVMTGTGAELFAALPEDGRVLVVTESEGRSALRQ